jgi:DNA replication protein DnaC
MTKTTDVTPELAATLRRLKLGKMLDTLPERLLLARQRKLCHRDFLLVVLQDEIARRDQNAISRRAGRARLDPDMQLERWDDTADVTFDHDILSELVSLSFVDEGNHVALVGPVGVGKTFLAHALGHIAVRRGLSVLAASVDRVLKAFKHARLDNSHETEMRKLIAVDLLILDDFALDAMDATESRDISELLTERHRAGSVIVTSNRGPDEWLATFADPVRAQSTIDRFANKAYDLVIDGESYRPRLKPKIKKRRKARQQPPA